LLDPCFSLAIGALLADAVERCTRLPIRVKWPNDLCAGSPPRKLGGVLLETTHGWMLVGVGINVNSKPADFPADLAPQLTTLGQELKNPYDVGLLQVAVVQALQQLPDIDLADWMQRFRERDCTGGTRYLLSVQGKQLPVTAEAVAEDGALLVRDAKGQEHRVAIFADLERA
jgi:BirA family biotin operon repressor/biotin-[acetyl-CoA-carboxylase] ligase